jgi:hypothetical protein
MYIGGSGVNLETINAIIKCSKVPMVPIYIQELVDKIRIPSGASEAIEP